MKLFSERLKILIENDLLTIIFPSYQRNEKIRLRIEEISSILNSIKVIIIDDCSNPSYTNFNHENLTLIQNKKNLGRGNSIIKALNLVSTKFVTIFDDDDIIKCENLKIIIRKLSKLDENYIGLVAETDQNINGLKRSFSSYLYERFNNDWNDRKEFVLTSILKESIPFWLKARRIPTSFLFSLCDRKDKYWQYLPIVVVNKIYLDGGMTNKMKRNPFTKSLHISVIYWIYRKFKILKYELF